MTSVIHWFRRDLRLTDNRALYAACQSGAAVIPLFVFDPYVYRNQRVGAPRLAFLLAALHALDTALQGYNTRLVVRLGDPQTVIPEFVAEIGASALYYNHDYSPYARRRDTALEKRLTVPMYGEDDVALLPPGSVLTATGTPYTVYTPFRKNWNLQPKPEVQELTLRAEMFHPLTDIPRGELPDLAQLGYTHPVLLQLPEANEAAAQKRLDAFIASAVRRYNTTRNQLPIDPFNSDGAGTSLLSPYLRFGLLSPRIAYAAARAAYKQTHDAAERASIETWVSELTWRDFYMHILYHYPYVLARDFQPKFGAVPWSDNVDHLQAWQQGMTGYPIIDAPMRQLNAIGWMPNRARMIVASFLTKDLFIHWKHGDIYFMQRLIDGDPAANNGGWQWAAGTGTDAQPYFRIFNPVSQSKQFATPDYLRHWLPELHQLSDENIHTPWSASIPPADYPPPIVDHALARTTTLAAFKAALPKGEVTPK